MSKRTMTKQHEPQAVAAAEAILRDLEAKRDKLLAFGRELAEARRAHAHQAHAVHDPDAQRELTDVAATIAMNDSMLASIHEAISEAQAKLAIASAYEAEVADRAKAQAILEILGAFKEAGHELDDALRTVGEMGKVLGNLLSQLHAVGVHSPSHQQLDVLGGQALLTGIMATPWAKRYPLLPPDQRRSFRVLVDGWAAMIEQRIRIQFGEKNKAA
jgi:hypothetical protein